MHKIDTSDLFRLLLSLIICQAAGIIGSFFTTSAIPTWYAALQKPSFNPPNAVFAPVWITLYLLMGIALFLVWRQGVNHAGVPMAMAVFGLQLFLNVLWSYFFFGLHAPLAGFVEIVFLWTSILIAMILFYRLNALAGLLLAPYLAWVSFAAVLNLSLWRLNT
ncbi:TspO/MBR family protein [candidate division KSB1 bacterium]